MPINRDLASLPVSKVVEPDMRPSADPLFAPLLAESWFDLFVDTEEHPKDLPTAAPCVVRHSNAGHCARQIGYVVTDTEASNPLTQADHYRFSIGHMVHDVFQKAAIARWPDAEIEHVVTFDDRGDGSFLSAGHGDLLVARLDVDGRKYHVELKTINGFGFQRAIGFKGNAEGPRSDALLQGALNAHGSDADVLVVLVLSLDCIAAVQAQKKGLAEWQRFIAEWRFERDEFQPMAEAELARFAEIEATIAVKELPERTFPDLPEGAVITDPARGTWEIREDDRIFDAGTTWRCGYCAFQRKCAEDKGLGL